MTSRRRSGRNPPSRTPGFRSRAHARTDVATGFQGTPENLAKLSALTGGIDMAAKRTSKPKPESLLAQIGIIGMEPIEPVILGALIGGEPLLLIGPHGTGKSYLLTRISAALGLELRH